MKNDALVMLTTECTFKFEIFLKGILKTSDYCIHPFGGGSSSDGQQLCYYKGCEDEQRLKYHMNAPGIVFFLMAIGLVIFDSVNCLKFLIQN